MVPLGVVSVVYGALPIDEIARTARADGFDELIGSADTPDGLALPISSRYTRPPEPGPGTYCSPHVHWSWEQTVAAFRSAPGCLLEPHPWCCVDTTEAVLAMLDEVPGLRLVVDVGHVTYWGGDPLELLPFAGAVQLRQARPGVAQCRVDEGTIDLAAMVAAALAADDRPALCVEYFDLDIRPEYRLDDPRGHAVELAEHLRPLLR